MMRRRISITTITTDTQRSRQDAIHPRVRGERGAAGLEPPAEPGLQVPGDRNHNRGGREPSQVIDQLELLIWSEGGLQDDHLAGLPGAGSCLRGADRFDRHPESRRSRLQALGEQKIVLDQEQPRSHGCRIPVDREIAALLAIAK